MKHRTIRLLGGLLQPLYAQCYTKAMRTTFKQPGAGDRRHFITRSPPDVSSSAFHTIYTFPRSSRAPRRVHMHGGAVLCSMNGKRYSMV